MNLLFLAALDSSGSQDWLKIALLAKEIQVHPLQLRYVPQESGGEGVSALLGKHIDVFSGELSNVSYRCCK